MGPDLLWLVYVEYVPWREQEWEDENVTEYLEVFAPSPEEAVFYLGDQETEHMLHVSVTETSREELGYLKWKQK